jgi:hypothetical protein
MKFQSFRSAVVLASVIVGSVIPSQAFAQTQIPVLTGGGELGGTNFTITSTYRFTDSMILNSIGFYTNGRTPTYLSYTIRGTRSDVTDFSVPNLSAEENGFRWLTISPQSMLNNETVTVSTRGPLAYDDENVYNDTRLYWQFDVNPSAKVSYDGIDQFGTIYTNRTNSNLRVSIPGTNVAPEPGTLALALTGGCALVGMCIRRRMSN